MALRKVEPVIGCRWLEQAARGQLPAARAVVMASGLPPRGGTPCITMFYIKSTIFHYTKAKNGFKKILALVLLKYYDLQTLQNSTNLHFFRRSIKSQVARPKAGPVTRPRVGRG